MKIVKSDFLRLNFIFAAHESRMFRERSVDKQTETCFGRNVFDKQLRIKVWFFAIDLTLCPSKDYSVWLTQIIQFFN